MLRISSQNPSKDQRILLSDPNWAFLTGHKDSIKEAYKNITAPEDFKLTPYDGFRNLVGNIDSKERTEFVENWKNRVHSFVEKMSKGPSNFFNLAALALHNSVNLGEIVWDHLPTIGKLWPVTLDINRANPHIERVAMCDWQFNQLPAISNSHIKWDDVGSLISRLNRLKIPGFWNEPLLDASIDYRAHLAEPLSYKQIEDTLVVQILMAIHSGRYEHLLDCANTFDEITPTSREKVFDGVVERVQPKLVKALDYVLNTQEPKHYIKPGTVIGTFKPSTQMSNFVSNEMNTSVTCDDRYLYVSAGFMQQMILNEYGKGQFLKVGSGMNGTIPGKVYLSKNSNITYLGNLTIVWVDGMLVLRSTNDKIGRLKIYNAETLELVREVRFFDNQITQETKLQELNRNYPLVSDGKRLFAILTKFKKADHVVKPDMKKYFDKAFQHEGLRKENKKDQCPANAIRKSEIMQAQLMETCLYEVHLDSNQATKIQSARDVKPDQGPLLAEMFDSFCGLYPMHTCYVALNLFNWEFQKAAEWLMQEGDLEATKKTIEITRHSLIAQSEVTGESHKVGQQYLLNASILSPIHSQMLQPGLWTMTSAKNGKMELTLHCNTPQRGNCAKIFTISQSATEQGVEYDPDDDVFIWQSQQLAQFNGNLNHGQPPASRSRPRGRGGMVRRGKKGGGPAQYYRGRGRGRGGYKSANLFGEESENSAQSEREHNDEEEMSDGGDQDEEEEGGPPPGRAYNHNPYLSPAKQVNQGDGVHHYITTLKDLAKMDPFYQNIYDEYDKAIDQDLKERNKELKEGRLFERLALLTAPMETVLTEEMDDQLCSNAYDHANNFFFPMILNRGVIAVCPHYGIMGEAVEKSVMSYLSPQLGTDFSSSMHELFRDTPHLKLKSFQDLKLHIFIFGLVAETKRAAMKDWHWDQWLLNYHIALQSDGNIGIQGPKPGCTLSDSEIKKIQSRLQKRKKQVQAYNIKRALEQAGVKWMDDGAREKKAKEEQQADERQRKKKEEKEKRLKKKEEQIKAKLASEGKLAAPIIEDDSEDNQSDQDQDEDPADENLTIDQMIGDYDDQEFMDALHKKGQVFLKQEYHKVMPFCLAGDISTLELLLRFLEDNKRLGVEKEFKSALRSTTMNLLLYWSRQSHHLVVTKQEGRPDMIERLLRLLLDIVKGTVPEMELTKREKRLAWLIIMNGWDAFITSTDRTFQILSHCLENDEFTQAGTSLHWEKYYLNMLGVGDTQFSSLALLLTKWKTWPDSFFPLIPFNLFGIDFCSIKQPKRGSTEYEYSIEQDTEKDRFMSEMVMQRGFYNIEYPEETSEFSLKFYTTPTSKPAKRSSSSTITEATQSYHQNIHAQLMKQREAHNNRAQKLWEVLTSKLVQYPEHQGLWILTTHLLNRAFSLSTWTSIFNLELVTDLVKMIKTLHEGIQFEKKTHFYTFLSISLSMLIGIAHLTKVEVLGFFLNILNPLIDIASSVLSDINALVLEHYHIVSIRRGSSDRRPQEGDDVEFLKNWALFLHEGIDFSQERVFETIHPYPLGDSNQKELFEFPGALGINVEMDPRSRVESTQDCITLDSSANHDNVNFQIDNTFQTTMNLGPRSVSSLSSPNFTIGPRVNVDFYGRNPVNQVRNNPQEVRWGYKLYLRPLYGQRVLLNDRLKSDSTDSNRLSTILELSRSFSRLIALVRDSTSLLISGHGLDTLGKECVGDKLIESEVQKIKREEEEGVCLNQKHKDFLDWYLFKGGLIQNKSEEQCLSDLMNHLQRLRSEKIDQIEAKMRKLGEKRSNRRSEELKRLNVPKKKKAKSKKQSEEKEKKEEFDKEQQEREQRFKKRVQKRKLLFKFTTEDNSKRQQVQSSFYRVLQQSGSLPHPNSKLRKFVDDILLHFDQQPGTSAKLGGILQILRLAHPYRQSMKVEQMLDTFTEDMKREWKKVESLALLGFMYHSSIDIERLSQECEDAQILGQENPLKHVSEEFKEDIKAIAGSLDKLLDWMIQRVRGEKEFQVFCRDVVNWRNEFVESYIIEQAEKKEKERQAKLNKQKKERDQQNKAALEEVKQKLKAEGKKEQEKKKQDAQEDEAKREELIQKKKSLLKKKPEIAVAKGAPRFQKKKSNRNFAKVKSGKKGSKAHDSSSIASSRAEDASQLSEVQSAISENPEQLDEANLELVQGDYFALRDKSLQELKEQIHNSVYSRFLEFYQGDIQKAVSLCKVVDAEFDPENPNTSLSLVFKFCKRSVLHEIDGGGGSSLLNQGIGRLRRNVPVEEMDSILGSPYEVVAKQVMRRALFLLLLKPTSELEQQIESGLSKDDFTSLALTRGESLNVANLGSQGDYSPRSRLSFLATEAPNAEQNVGGLITGVKSKITGNSKEACKFLCSQCDLRGLKQDFQQQRRRAALRRAGLEFNQATIELCKNTPFARRSTGLLSQRLRKSALQGVESSGIDMLIKINEVALQTALTHMESVNSNYTSKLIEKLSRTSPKKHQLYMSAQPILLEILTHICEVSLLFEDKFTKEFIFKLLNQASSNFDEIPVQESGNEPDPLYLDKEASVGASTDLENDLLVRFNSSQLLEEHAVRLRQASLRRCSNFSNMIRVIGRFVTQLIDLHFSISQTQSVIPSKLVNLLKFGSLGLIDLLMGDSSQQCLKLNQLAYKSAVKHLEAALQDPLTDIQNIKRIQDILLLIERFPRLSPQAVPLLEAIILQSNAPVLVQHALKMASSYLSDNKTYQKMIVKVGQCILPDIGGSIEQLRESMIHKRKHHVYLHINAPNSDNYSFLFSALYHYEEECLKRDAHEYKRISLLHKSQLYKPIKNVQDLKKRFPDKLKRKKPKLPPDQPPEPKKEPAAQKPPPRKRRTQELAQDYIHENPLQGLETLKGAFQEYSSLFMEPVYLNSDSEQEIKRKIDFYNWNERVMNHIKQAQRIAALLTSCGVANFCDVSLKGASQPYSYFGQNAGLYAGNVALNQKVEPPSPLQYQEAVFIGHLIKNAYLEKLPRIAANPFFRHWRAQNNFNTERATLNFNQQNMEWLFPLEAKLTVAQEQALQNALQEFDEREQLKPRKISLAEPAVTVSLVDSNLHDRLTTHLQHYISKDVNWIQNVPRVDLSKLERTFEGAEGFFYLMSDQASWPESASLSTMLQKESNIKPVSSMLGQLNNPSTQFYSNSKLKDLDKKRFNGFTQDLKQIPIICAQSNEQIIQWIAFQLKRKIIESEEAKAFFKSMVSSTLQAITKGSWKHYSVEEKQKALGTLQLVAGWYNALFQGKSLRINSKTYTSLSFKDSKINVINQDGDIEEFDQNSIQTDDVSDLVQHSQIAESILVCSEQNIEGPDSLLLMLLLKIAGKLNWQGAEQEHAAKLISLLITLSQNKSPLSSGIAEFKSHASWKRLIEKLNLETHFVTECLDEVKAPQTEELKQEIQKDSESQEESTSVLKQPSQLILGYALPESEYIKDMPRTMQNVTNEVGLRLLHYWEKTLIPRTVQYCSSFPIQVLTNSIAQVRVPLRMGDITNATESILILLDRKVPNGCIIPSFNHDWSALIAEEIKVGSVAIAEIVQASTDYIDTDHPLLNNCFQRAGSFSSSSICFPALVLKFDQKLQAALCAITDPLTAQMYYVWIGCGSLYPMSANQQPHITGISSQAILDDFCRSVKEVSGVYAQETLLTLFYASGIFDPSKLSLLNLIEKSVQIELADRTINGWLDGIQNSLPLRPKSLSDKKEDKDLSSFVNMNLVIERVREQDQEQLQSKKYSRTYLGKFKEHLISKCSLEELESLGDWCLQQWEVIKSAQSRRTLDLRELHQQQARTPEHNRYTTSKLIQLHSEDEIGAGVILVFQKDAYLSSNSKLSFYSDPQRINLIQSVQAGRTDKLLEPIVFDSGKVWCEYSPGSFALLTEVEQRNPRKSQLGCSVVVVPQSWPTCCWLTENLTSALVYKCVSDKSAALCGLKLTKKLIGALCGFYEKGFSPAQIVQLLFRLMTRLIHKVRYFKGLVGEEETENPEQAVGALGLEAKWLIQVAKNINTLIKKNRSSLTPPLIQEGVELLVTALVSPFERAQIKYSELKEAKLYPWLRASLDVASFLHNLSGSKKPEPMPDHIEEEVLSSLFLDSSDVFKNVFYFAQTESKEEEKKEQGDKEEQQAKGPEIIIKLEKQQLHEAVRNAVKNGHAKMLNPRTDIAIQSEGYDEGVLFINGWDVFYDEDEEGPDVIENDSDAEEGEGQKEEEAPPAEVEEQGWSCPQCTFINAMEELVCMICGQGMRPAVQPHQEVVEEDPNAEEDLTLTNDVIDLEKKQKSRTKRRRKYFLEILEQALKSKVTELKNAHLEKWNHAEDKRIKEVRDKLGELEKKRKEKEEQLREEQKKAKQDQEQKKKPEEPKQDKPIEVPKSEQEKELENQLKRKQHPEYKEPQFIVRSFIDAKDKNFKFVNNILKARLELFVKPESELTYSKIAQEICDELKDIEPDNEKTLPKLPEAPLAQGLGFTEWKQLKEMKPDVLANSMEELIELDVSALIEFLVSMGYDFHFNKMHSLTTPPNIPRFGARKLQLLRHLVEDKMCRETKSVFGLRGSDFFLAGKSRGFDWETDPEPIGTFKDRLNTKIFTSLEKEDLLTLRYNWALLKNFNAKLESAISLIKIRSNSLISDNKFTDYEQVPLALNVYINASRGICFSNIKRDLIQDAIYKTEVTVERRAKLEFQRLKLAESLLKPADGDQDPLSSIQNKTQQVKLLPPNEIQRDVKMLAAILEDEEESKEGAPGVKNATLKLSREMSDWASSNLSSKKISRSMSPSHKDSSSRLQKLDQALKFEVDDFSEDGSTRVLQGVRDPFAQLDQIVLQSQITHNESLGQQLQTSLGGESESQKQAAKSDSTMFAQAFNQVKKLDLSLLRAAKVKGTFAVSFDVKFRGEHVAGQGGPYRQFFADISAQLQPSGSQSLGAVDDANGEKKGSALSLLIPTPNNKSKQQDSKDKFIVNPRQTNMELFEFLGVMMGCCIRTGVHLTLNLPTLFWKMLTGEKILITDIEEVDDGFARQIKSVIAADSQEYLDAIFQNYSVKSVDWVTDINMFNKPSDEILKFQDKTRFVEEALRQRFKEIELQTNAIKRGIAKMVPVVLLSLTTCHELEILICGKTSVDIDLLERHTIYSGNLKLDSPRVLYFWETLREMSEDDQLRFIKFCWGQERLPANDQEFIRARVRFMVKPALDGSHGDNALPKADTCFFNLQLPNYSSKDILKQKLLLAIYFDCDSMNAENAAVQDLNEPEAYEEEE